MKSRTENRFPLFLEFHQFRFARIHHDDAHRRQRQGVRQRATHMARTENIDVRAHGDFRIDLADKLIRKAMGHEPEAQAHTSAAALAYFRSQWHIQRCVTTARKNFPGVLDRHIFKLPAADGAKDRIARHQHPRPASRGAEPFTSVTSTSTQSRPFRAGRWWRKARISSRAPGIVLAILLAEPFDRHQHTFRRCRRIKARADLIVGHTGDSIGKRMQH